MNEASEILDYRDDWPEILFLFVESSFQGAFRFFFSKRWCTFVEKRQLFIEGFHNIFADCWCQEVTSTSDLPKGLFPNGQSGWNASAEHIKPLLCDWLSHRTWRQFRSYFTTEQHPVWPSLMTFKTDKMSPQHLFVFCVMNCTWSFFFQYTVL